MTQADGVCKHGQTEAHHFTADDYPVPGLWRCDGPELPLLPDELDDLAAGDHYEREAPAGAQPTCICGVPWICPMWIEQVCHNLDSAGGTRETATE